MTNPTESPPTAVVSSAGSLLTASPLRAGRKTSEFVAMVLGLVLAAAGFALPLIGVGHPPAVARDAIPGAAIVTGGGVAAFYAIGRSGLKAVAIAALHWTAGHRSLVSADLAAAGRYVSALAAEAQGRAPAGTAAAVLRSAPDAATLLPPPAPAGQQFAGQPLTLEQEVAGVLARTGAHPSALAGAIVRAMAGPPPPSGGGEAGMPGPAPGAPPGQGEGPQAGPGGTVT